MKLIHALSFCALCCAACSAPSDWKLPSQALRYASASSTEGSLRIGLLPVMGAAWQAQPTPATDQRWQRRLAYLHYQRIDGRDLYVPLVPQPSLEVMLANDGDTPISLEHATITVTDSDQRTYALATSSHEYLEDVLDPMIAVNPTLWLTQLRYGPAPGWPEKLTASQPTMTPDGYEAARALRDAADKVPLLGTSVVIPPHRTWVGAMVLRRDARSIAETADAMRGTLYVAMSGLRAGDTTLPGQLFTLPLSAEAEEVVCANGSTTDDPAQCRPDVFTTPVEDGPCMERSEMAPRSREVPRHTSSDTDVTNRIWVDGTSVTHSDAFGVLLANDDSRRDAKSARALRAAGNALIATGIASSAVTTGTLIASGHEGAWPAGLSFLGVSAVGAGLNYLGYQKEMKATREFNHAVFDAGACAAPR